MNKYLTLSNLIYGSSILFALGVLAKIYLERRSLPPGVCPITNSSGLMYLAIGWLIVSTVITSIIDRKNKKSKDQDEIN